MNVILHLLIRVIEFDYSMATIAINAKKLEGLIF